MRIPVKQAGKLRKFWKNLGPGLITGASDDDPSGIATYTQAGARFGFSMLWTAIITYPLMSSIQDMCARIGLVTGKGLTGVIRNYLPRWVLILMILVSFPSIVLNIGADLAGMGAVANLLAPEIPVPVFTVLFTFILMGSIIFLSYRKIAMILKWLCLALLCYIAVPFFSNPDWPTVIGHTLLPEFKWDGNYIAMLVAILGTTISPYLFFWQTSVEVEEVQTRHVVVDKKFMNAARRDVKSGIAFSNIVFYFIILAAGSVLHTAGIHDIETVEQAASALKPLAGNQAYLLFAIGILGTGLLAIPVLAGSLSYMMAETFNWPQGLDKKFHEAKRFYAVLIIALLIALGINFTGVSPVKALIYTAVVYGVTAHLLIAILLRICNRPEIMGEYTNSRKDNIIGAVTLILMSTAAVVLFLL